MKIIVADCAFEGNKNGADALDITGNPVLWLKADSALLTNGKPFFIPDFTNECSAAVCLAVRICRLGKCISARFAERYYDALGVAIDFTAEDVLRKLREERSPWDMAKSFDSSVVMGKWEAVDEDWTGAEVEISMQINNCEKVKLTINDAKGKINNIVEAMSKIFTLRQGDILMLYIEQEKPVVAINDHIVGCLNGGKMTEFNIK